MRKALLIAAVLIYPATAHAADSYAIRLMILNGKGVQTFYANNGESYRTYDECSLRQQAWERKQMPGYQAAIETLRKQGQTAELSVSCERTP